MESAVAAQVKRGGLCIVLLDESIDLVGHDIRFGLLNNR